MKTVSLRTFAIALAVTASLDWRVRANSDLVQFPGNHADGVHDAIVERGNIGEELFTSREAIDAAKSIG